MVVKKGWLRHSFEFFLVLLVLVTSIILLEIFTGTWVRLGITIFASLLYIAAGIFHHWEEKNLNSRAVWEHVAIGSFIFLILQAVYK